MKYGRHFRKNVCKSIHNSEFSPLFSIQGKVKFSATSVVCVCRNENMRFKSRYQGHEKFYNSNTHLQLAIQLRLEFDSQYIASTATYYTKNEFQFFFCVLFYLAKKLLLTYRTRIATEFPSARHHRPIRRAITQNNKVNCQMKVIHLLCDDSQQDKQREYLTYRAWMHVLFFESQSHKITGIIVIT